MKKHKATFTSKQKTILNQAVIYINGEWCIKKPLNGSTQEHLINVAKGAGMFKGIKQL